MVFFKSTSAVIALYVSCMVSANLLIAYFGPWFSPINAFVLIGLDMVVRDVLHDRWLKSSYLYPKILSLTVVSGVITFLLNPAALMISIASAVAFTLAMITNTLVYGLVSKKPWLFRSNTSNISGSTVDSIVFPTIAFGSVMPEIIIIQVLAKTCGGFIWSFMFKVFGGKV